MEQKKRSGLFGKLKDGYYRLTLKDGYYRFKPFKRIKADYVLITRNIFNGKKVKIKDGGFTFLCPWTEIKPTSIKEKDIDYKPDVFEDIKGMDLLLDNVITVKITDPIKYEYSHSDIEGRLKNLLDSSLRVFLKKYPYEFLAMKNFKLPKANSVIKTDTGIYMDVQKVNGETSGRLIYDESPKYTEDGKYDVTQLQGCFVSDLARLRAELNEFEKKYGLALVNFECKKIMPSEEVRKQQEELKLSEEKVKIAENEAKAETIKAKGTATAETIRFKKILELLRESGMSPEEQGRFMSAYMYSNGGNQDVAKATAAAISGATAGMVAGQMQKDSDVPKKK